jgi:hypothetical protein
MTARTSTRRMNRAALKLGFRWALHPAIGFGRLRAVHTIIGAAVAAMTIGVVFGMLGGAASRAERASYLSPAPASADRATFSFLSREDPYRDQLWRTLLVRARVADPPAPPGIPHFPRPGEAYVSPALARLLAERPELALRLPGRVVGLIGKEALEAPDVLDAVVGVDPGNTTVGINAASWGYKFSNERPLVPATGLFLSAGLLVGVPLILFAVVVSRLSANERRRRSSGLALLGVSRSAIVRATRVEAATHAFFGSILGVLTAHLLLPTVAARALLGFAWFPPIGFPLALPILSVISLVAVVAIGASAGTRSFLREDALLSSRQTAPVLRARLVRQTVFFIGCAILLTLVLSINLGGRASFNSTHLVLPMVLGIVMAASGAVFTLAPMIDNYGHRVSTRMSGTMLVARRRLSSDPTGAARSAIGIVLIIITASIASGVIADVNAVSISTSDQSIWISTSGIRGTRAVINAAALPLALQPSHANSDASSVLFATCASLIEFMGAGDLVDRREVSDKCKDGHRYWIVDATSRTNGIGQPPPPGEIIAVHNLFANSVLSNALQLATDNPIAHASDAAHATVWVLTHHPAGSSENDALITRIFKADAEAQYGYLGVDQVLRYQLPTLRRLVRGCALLGLLIALGAFLVVASDRFREQKRQSASLTVIGAPLRFIVGVTIRQNLAVAYRASVLAAVAGWLAAAAYITVGGRRSWFISGLALELTFVVASVAISVTTVAGTAWISSRRLEASLIRRE